MSYVALDTECYKKYFYVGFKRLSDGKRMGFELSRRTETFNHEQVRKILMSNTIIGFNLQGYDNGMIWYALELLERGVPFEVINRKLKEASDGIIQGGVRWWDVEKFLDIRIPWRYDFIDLIEPQPNAFASLKTLNGRLHGKRLQDLPYPPDADLTDSQMDDVSDYCLTSDLDATENLFNHLKEPLELRVALGKQYGMDFRSKSDSQIGEAIVKKRTEDLTGRKVVKQNKDLSVEDPNFMGPGKTFRYPIPDFLKFETPQLQAVLDRLRETDFVVKANGKVALPKWLIGESVKKAIEVYGDVFEVDESPAGYGKITIGSSTYQMGIGGLHSTESNRAVKSDREFVLIDADVASMYPTLILMLRLAPSAFGEAFFTGYADIKDDRLAAKARGKEIKKRLKFEDNSLEPHEKAALQGELLACEVVDKGLKIALNGVFGKLGSWYSSLYAPHLLLGVTLTGQLSLLMLAERALLAGIDAESGNTDGLLFVCPREFYDGLDGDKLKPSFIQEICAQWERDTGMVLEFQEYKAVYSRDVNNYMAIKTDGGHKRKGVYGNWWSEHPDDRDPRMMLMKNPTMTICSDAALNLIKDGTPIENTIYNCTDITQFVTVVKSTGGATWRGRYLGKVVRFYWSTDGDPILKAKPNDKTGNYAMVSKTEGSAPCMTLPDELPDDINYNRYVVETKKMLKELGYYGKVRPPMKLKRFSKANTASILLHWALIT